MNKYISLLILIVIASSTCNAQTNGRLDTIPYYDFVEVMPTYKGDINLNNARIEVMQKMKTSCPIPTDSNKILIHFIIEPDGTVNKATILKGICDEMNSQAIEEIKKLKYTPGQQKGKVVRVKAAMILKFQ